jgi:hypothetical protein
MSEVGVDSGFKGIDQGNNSVTTLCGVDANLESHGMVSIMHAVYHRVKSS